MPQDLLYSKTHEWLRLADDAGGKTATVGLTAFALEMLTDLVHVELPPVGRQVKAGQPFGEIESVKAVSDLYSPVDGQITEVNPALAGNLEHLAEDPYGQGWFIKIKLSGEAGLSDLLDEAAYKRQCAEEQH
jgi:glycine cleavage system H protein